MNDSLLTVPPVETHHVSHSHSNPFISHYNDVIGIPPLSSLFDLILSDDNAEDVCTEMDNDVSLILLYDTHINCDVITPSNTCFNDDVLSPQQYSHECSATICHDISAMCNPIPHDCNTSMMFDSEPHVITMMMLTSLFPTVFGLMYRHSFHTLFI